MYVYVLFSLKVFLVLLKVTRYAVRKKSVISHADKNVYFIKVPFSSRTTTNVTSKSNVCRAYFRNFRIYKTKHGFKRTNI